MRRTLLLLALGALVLVGPQLAAAQPAGRVVIAQGVDPTTLDTQNQQETPGLNVVANIFDTLVERDQNLKIVPRGRGDPELVAPRRRGSSSCARGVKFHNGEDFNAESVKFSLERLINPANKLRGRADLRARSTGSRSSDPLHGAGPHQEAVADLPRDHMALRQASMYPPKEYAGKDAAVDLAKNPIGTGPYKFVRWAKDEEIVMEAFPSVLGRGAEDQDGRVQADPRRRGAGGRAPERRDRRGGEHPAAPGQASSRSTRRSSSARRRPSATIQLMYLHAPDGREPQADRARTTGPPPTSGCGRPSPTRVDADEIIKGVLDGKAMRVATMLHEPALRLRPVAQADQAGPGEGQEAPGRGRLPERRSRSC